MSISTPNQPSDTNKDDIISSKTSAINMSDDLKKLLKEKPNSNTIRKAIIGTAEEKALQELLDAPEQRHIDEVLDFYRLAHSVDPKFLSQLIVVTAKIKDIKDELGHELYALYSQVWEELVISMKTDIADAMAGVNHPAKNSKKQRASVIKNYFDEKAEELKKNPRILSDFSGKEALLDKMISYTVCAYSIIESFATQLS